MLKSPHVDRLIAAHQFQGTSNDCGPYTTAIVLTLLKNNAVSGAELAQELNCHPRSTHFPFWLRIPNWATFPWGIVELLKKSRISAKWQALTSTEKIKHAVRVGKIVIVLTGSWLPPRSHYRIVVAHHADQGWGFVDPALPQGAITWQAEKIFLSSWSKWGRVAIFMDANI